MHGASQPPGAPSGGPPPAPGAGGAEGGKEGKNLFNQPKAAVEDEEKKAGPYIHMPRHGAAWLLLIASIVMLITLAAPWWAWTINSDTGNTTIYLSVWDVSCGGPSCIGGSSSTPLNVPSVPVLTSGNLPANLGSLYGAAAFMAIIAAIFGLVAAVLMFMVARGISEQRKAVDRAVLLSYLAVALSLAIPVMLSIAQPASFRGDLRFPINMSPSPGSSFYGSLGPGTYNGVTYSSLTWGPTFSWYLCVLAGALFFGGGIVPHLTRHEPVARSELIHKGLIKLPVTFQRPLPPGFRPGLPAPYAAAYGPRPMGGPAQATPMYAGYGPSYQSLAPGVGWARPLPPGARPPGGPAALPPGAPYRPAPSYSPSPPPAVYRPQPQAALPPPAIRPVPSAAPMAAARPTPSASPPVAMARPVPAPAPPVAARPVPSGPAVSSMTSPTPSSSPSPGYTARPLSTPASSPAPATTSPTASAAAAPARPKPPSVPASGNRTCSSCGTFVPPPALRCTKCGALLPRS